MGNGHIGGLKIVQKGEIADHMVYLLDNGGSYLIGPGTNGNFAEIPLDLDMLFDDAYYSAVREKLFTTHLDEEPACSQTGD